ncbi:unnamed protein product [Thelazia callipaeda]|uniref:LsmAD domain-containing protein n=1 Tax=Thelazia callipaeda TaxID=103827 RepID=A0A0N5D9J4_THECL|nr:unnamed protein product [Thelazia callipaeda]
MPHKIQDESNICEVRGLYGNQDLLALITRMIGKEIIVETRDGTKFEGIFAGCSPDVTIFCFFYCLLNTIDEFFFSQLIRQFIIDKLQFDRDCVFSVEAKCRDEKRIEGFATDREYADQSAPIMDMELQAWETEEDYDGSLSLNEDQENGWSAEQMFQANDILGVKSTFDENMVEYATADVQGDAEDFKRAERIAQEINSSSTSRARAQLENDDEERDLDKETSEFRVQQNSRKISGAGRGNQSGNTRDKGTFNMSRGPPNSKRLDGIPGAARGRTYGSGSSRLFTNSSMGHSLRGPGAVSGPASRYLPSGILERPTAQELHLQFGRMIFFFNLVGILKSLTYMIAIFSSEWVRRGESSGPISVTENRGGRQTEQVIGNNGRVYNQRLATNHHEGQLSRDESRNLHYQNTSNNAGSSSRQLTSKQTERVRNLKEFHQNFNSTFQPSHSVHTTNDESQRTNTTQGPATSTVVSRPVNNAWNKGPPPGMRGSVTSSTQVARSGVTCSDVIDLPSGKDVEVSAAIVTVTSGTTAASSCTSHDQRTFQSTTTRARGLVQTTVNVTVPGRSSLTAAASSSPSTVALAVVSESRPAKSVSATARSCDRTPPSCADVIARVSEPQTSTTHTHQTHHLSAAASSSSIAPTDPTPSAPMTDTAKTTTTNVVSTTSDGRQFVWNPDAPSFVPRNQSVTTYRNPEHFSHRPTVHSIRTPPGPQPLMSAHIAAPSHVQGLALANAQGLSVQTVPSIAHAGPPQMFPYAQPNAYGPAVPVYYSTPVVHTTPSVAAATATAANVTGGPIVANTNGLPVGRQGQMSGQINSSNRRNQQQFIQGVTGMYVPGASQPYAQQLMTQYQVRLMQCLDFQVPYFAPFPSQLSIGTSSMPPPPLPPPTTNTVLTGPPPYPLIQIHMMPRLPHPHATIDYSVAAPTVLNAQQQQPQQVSSSTSSNGTGSNGQNSQTATPGPVVSPPQVHQQQQPSLTHYPQSGTPQSPHTLFVTLPPGQPTSASAQPHLYVQAPQFPFLAAGQPGFVMAYGPQPVVVHPPVAAPTAHIPFSQAHQTHGQVVNLISGPSEHFQVSATEPAVVPQPSLPGAHQAYISGTSDQIYGQYMHVQPQHSSAFQQSLPQQPSQQQAAGNVGSLRNSVNPGTGAPPLQHQTFQPGVITPNSSAAPSKF